jgi:hypothetical protein
MSNLSPSLDLDLATSQDGDGCMDFCRRGYLALQQHDFFSVPNDLPPVWIIKSTSMASYLSVVHDSWNNSEQLVVGYAYVNDASDPAVELRSATDGSLLWSLSETVRPKWGWDFRTVASNTSNITAVLVCPYSNSTECDLFQWPDIHHGSVPSYSLHISNTTNIWGRLLLNPNNGLVVDQSGSMVVISYATVPPDCPNTGCLIANYQVFDAEQNVLLSMTDTFAWGIIWTNDGPSADDREVAWRTTWPGGQWWDLNIFEVNNPSVYSNTTSLGWAFCMSTDETGVDLLTVAEDPRTIFLYHADSGAHGPWTLVWQYTTPVPQVYSNGVSCTIGSDLVAVSWQGFRSTSGHLSDSSPRVDMFVTVLLFPRSTSSTSVSPLYSQTFDPCEISPTFLIVPASRIAVRHRDDDGLADVETELRSGSELSTAAAAVLVAMPAYAAFALVRQASGNWSSVSIVTDSGCGFPAMTYTHKAAIISVALPPTGGWCKGGQLAAYTWQTIWDQAERGAAQITEHSKLREDVVTTE